MNKRKTQPKAVTPKKRKTPVTHNIVFLTDEQMYLVTAGGKQNKYGVGSSVRVGDCGHVEERGAWTAKTLDDAKQMAQDFASNMTKTKGI